MRRETTEAHGGLRRALDGLYDGCAALAALFMVGLLVMVMLPPLVVVVPPRVMAPFAWTRMLPEADTSPVVAVVVIAPPAVRIRSAPLLRSLWL